LAAAFSRLRDDLRRALPRVLDLLVGLARRQFERAAPLLARGEAVGDGLLPRLDGAQHERPNELYGKPDKGRERHGLGNQGQIEVHATSPSG